MSKPIIGIVEWPYVDKDGDQIYEVLSLLISSVSRSGGLPIGIFPTQTVDYNNMKLSDIPSLTIKEQLDLLQSLKMCDAIIKPGATRIYEYERQIYAFTRDMNIPYLGICAGMQTMNHYGRENVINKKNDSNSPINHYQKGIKDAHLIKIEPNSMLHNIIEKDEIMVNSHHHYHVPNAGIHNVSAYALDGVIEAIENPNYLFQFGLQWHPELMNEDDENSKKIFDGLVDAAYTYKKRIKK